MTVALPPRIHYTKPSITALEAGYAADAAANGSRRVTGEEAFALHDTYGFPIELTREIAGENGATVDVADFESRMDEQRARARDDAAAKRGVFGLGHEIFFGDQDAICETHLFLGFFLLVECVHAVLGIDEKH